MTRTDFGGAVFATYRVCASGHRFYLERDAAELDRGVDWWDATRDAEECWIPVQDAARLLDEARRLIADVGDGELVSGAPVTDLFTDSVALLRPAGAERVGCYWGGATARTVDEVQRCVEGARRLDPDMPRDRLEQCARITSFVIAVRDAVVGHGGAPPPGGPSPPGRSPGQESGGR